jgi:uncharacterized membrane protein YgdD (TMEM256/DUF423 family)
MQPKFLIIAAFFGFFDVVAGAFASHNLREVLPPERMELWETAVRYAMYHTIALFLTGSLMEKFPVVQLRMAAWSFIVGVIVFSGSLALVALTGEMWFAAITPFGGSGFLFGWGFLGAGVWKATYLHSEKG